MCDRFEIATFAHLLPIAFLAPLAVSAPLGCASSNTARVGHPTFPADEELASIEETPPPAEYFDQRRSSVQEWKLEGDLPETLETVEHRPKGPFERQLASFLDSSSRPGTLATRGMHCVARQVGVFGLEQGALPDMGLREFIRSRCGAAVGTLTLRWRHWDSPSQGPSRARAEDLFADASEALRSEFDAQNLSAGIWYGSSQESSLAVVAVARRHVDLEPIDLVQPKGSTFELRGELLGLSAAEFFGRATSGHFDSEVCDTIGDVDPPRFHLRCQVDNRSAWTVAELLARPEERLLSTAILSSYIWRNGADNRTYRVPEAGRVAIEAYQKRYGDESDSKTALSEPELTARFLALLNAVRREADLPALTLESDQAEEVARLSGRFFQKVSTGDPDVQDKIIRGLSAGWHVDGPIVDAHSFTTLKSGLSTVALLRYTLSSPSARNALLREEYDRLAATVTPSGEGDGLGLLAFSYRAPTDDHLGARIEKVVDTINEARADRGAPAIATDGSLYADAKRVAEQLESGDIDVEQAQQIMGDAALDKWDTDVELFAFATQDLEDFTLPDRLARPGLDYASVVVAPYHPSGAAWVSYVVLLTYRDSGESQMVQVENGETLAQRQ